MRRIGTNEGSDLRLGTIKTSHQRLYLLGLNEGFIALDIDDDGVCVVLFTPRWGSDTIVSLQTAVGTAAMVCTRHDHFASERLYSIVDPLVVGSYYDGVQRFGCLFVHTADDGLAADLSQWFARKTRRCVTGRDDSYKFHISLFSIFDSKLIAPAIVLTLVMVTYRLPVLIPFLSVSSCRLHRSARLTAYWMIRPNTSDCQ